MLIKDEADLQRVADAAHHDSVLVMIGDPETGRPLLKLSVTKAGAGVIEYDDGDLAPGILALNELLSRTIVGAGLSNARPA